MTGRISKRKIKQEYPSSIKVKIEDDLNIFKNPIKIESESENEFDIEQKEHADDKHQDHTLQLRLNTLNLILNQNKLSLELPNYEFNRKPKLKFRPLNGTVLNLNQLNFLEPFEDQIHLEDLYFLHHALTFAKKTVIITGAGISVNSGIPDFRSSNGLFQGLKSKSTGSGKNLFDYNVFRDHESIVEFEKMIEKLYKLSNVSKPSPFHMMINDISKQNRLLRLYTQNIDCIETQLPNLKTEIPLTFNKSKIPKTVQLHGNIKLLNCSKCNYITELNENYFSNGKFGQNKLIKSCPSCEELNMVRKIAGKRIQTNGILRPRIVLYNEFHPDGEIIGSITEKDLKSRPDCLIITGTTLKIPGVRRLVKEMAKTVHSNKGYVIWINIDEPSQNIIDYVEYFDLIIVGDCQLVPGLVKYYDFLNPLKIKEKKKEHLINKKKTCIK